MAQITAWLLRPEFWLALIVLIVLLVLAARQTGLRWWPALLLRLGLVAAVLLGLFATRKEVDSSPIPAPAVMVVDQSDSLAEATRAQALRQALEWQAGGENRLVVAFGARAQAVVAPPGAASLSQENGTPPQSALAPVVDGRASSLDEALTLAGDLLSGQAAGMAGQAGEQVNASAGTVILVSDGLAAQPEPVSQALERLRAQGHSLQFSPLAPRPAGGDAAVGGLSVPANVWSGTPFDLLAPLYGGQPGQLRLLINGQDSGLAARPAGENTALFHIPSLPEGMVTLQVEAGSPGGEGSVPTTGEAAAPDPFPGNNSAYAVMQVFPSPRILLVTSRAEDAEIARFGQVLVEHGMQVDAVSPDLLPTNLGSLQAYRVILLDNLLSSQLTREQMTALQVFASRLAGGLVFLGGRNSYTLGGYRGTLLEPMLPVELEPPPRTERPPLVFQLILDRSSSMKVGAAQARGQPIALAREAAMRSIEMLHAEDYLGVLTFSDESEWAVPLRLIGGTQGLRQALDAVSQVEAEGGTNMFHAMEEALAAIIALPPDAPRNRHVLLLTDGQSFDGSDESFNLLAQTAQVQGITISTIALGLDADSELLETIAEAGKGRYYAVKNPNDLPRILLSESQAARSENVQTGETSLKVGEAGHPILSGLSPAQLPLLIGYNALRSRVEEGAEDVLVSSSFGDPILSAWQYGLGRVVAWTGDIGGEWTGDWPPDAEGKFWSQVVRYALPNPALGPAQVNVQVQPSRLVVEAALFNERGDPLNLAQVNFTYSGADGQTHPFRMAQERAGIYRLEIPRPPDGAYRGVISYRAGNGKRLEFPAPFAVNPPAEWLPPDPALGAANMQAWAQGQPLVNLGQALAEDAARQDEGAPGLDQAWQWLLLALVILWPLEIAIRRRWLPWSY